MNQRGIEKANILGFSDGGNIAMVFSLAHPERVHKLVLNGANLNASGVRKTVQIPIEIGYRIARRFATKNPECKKRSISTHPKRGYPFTFSDSLILMALQK